MTWGEMGVWKKNIKPCSLFNSIGNVPVKVNIFIVRLLFYALLFALAFELPRFPVRSTMPLGAPAPAVDNIAGCWRLSLKWRSSYFTFKIRSYLKGKPLFIKINPEWKVGGNVADLNKYRREAYSHKLISEWCNADQRGKTEKALWKTITKTDVMKHFLPKQQRTIATNIAK